MNTLELVIRNNPLEAFIGLLVLSFLAIQVGRPFGLSLDGKTSVVLSAAASAGAMIWLR